MSDVSTLVNQEIRIMEMEKPSHLLKVDANQLRSDVDYQKLELVTGGDEDKLDDLAKGVVGLSNLLISSRADTLILLDKSARPVAELLKNLWRESFPDMKIPEIRFVNIGRGDTEMDKNLEYIRLLKKAHSQSLQDRKVIVADEFSSSGSTLRRAKGVLENTFPRANFIYTAILRSVPTWYGNSYYLGVYDFDDLPFNYSGGVIGQLQKKESDTYISKSLAGVVRRNPSLIKLDTETIRDDLSDRQTSVNQIRAELSYLGKKIAGSCKEVTEKEVNLRPNLPHDLDRALN